ncbi:MAG: hypothetical protein IJC02_01635 [Lachnospiraceae bacterium]|nr:hypothetical protein [Lachnospiraceae bacterium]
MKRVVLFGNESGLAILKNAAISEYIQIVAVVYSQKRIKSKETAIEISKELKCTAIEQPYKYDTGEYKRFLEEIKELTPSMGICYAYDIIFKEDLLNTFEDGIFNFHGALLPKYRGANALNWVLVNGEKETGMTIHKMSAKVDAGEIILQKRIPIDFKETAVSLKAKMLHSAEQLLLAFISQIENECITMHPQDESEKTCVRRRKPEDGFFTWDQEPIEIYNLIRALVFPWPGARYIENGEEHIISEFVSYEDVCRMKQEVLKRRENNIW